jgi:hypothetical protein
MTKPYWVTNALVAITAILCAGCGPGSSKSTPAAHVPKPAPSSGVKTTLATHKYKAVQRQVGPWSVTIQPVAWDGKSSASLEISITGKVPGIIFVDFQPKGANPVFIKAEVNKPRRFNIWEWAGGPVHVVLHRMKEETVEVQANGKGYFPGEPVLLKNGKPFVGSTSTTMGPVDQNPYLEMRAKGEVIFQKYLGEAGWESEMDVFAHGPSFQAQGWRPVLTKELSLTVKIEEENGGARGDESNL